MLAWVKHSWIDEHADPETGPMPSLMDEMDGVTAVEVVSGHASVIVAVGHHQAFVKGDGVIDLEELAQAQQLIDVYGRIRCELDTLQDPRMYSEEDLGIVGPMIAVEDRLIREAAEFAVRHSSESGPSYFSITADSRGHNDFARIVTYLSGIRAEAVYDLKHGGELVGIVRCEPDSDDRWAAMTLMQMAKDETFAYVFDGEEEALNHLRETSHESSLQDLSDAIKGSDLMIERHGIVL